MQSSEINGDQSSGEGAVLPSTLVGDNHPLAQAAPQPANNAPVEIIQGPSGAVEEKPLARLAAGDHTIQFADGRQFMVHVPKAADSSDQT